MAAGLSGSAPWTSINRKTRGAPDDTSTRLGKFHYCYLTQFNIYLSQQSLFPALIDNSINKPAVTQNNLRGGQRADIWRVDRYLRTKSLLGEYFSLLCCTSLPSDWHFYQKLSCRQIVFSAAQRDEAAPLFNSVSDHLSAETCRYNHLTCRVWQKSDHHTCIVRDLRYNSVIIQPLTIYIITVHGSFKFNLDCNRTVFTYVFSSARFLPKHAVALSFMFASKPQHFLILICSQHPE